MSDKTGITRSRTVECETCEGTTFTVSVREVFGEEHFCVSCVSCESWRISSPVKPSVFTEVRTRDE